MSGRKPQEFTNAINSISDKIAGFQKMQDDILSADLRPVLKELSEIDCERSATNANRFAESLVDLTYLGLEKTRKLQRGYIKPSPEDVWTVLKDSYRLPNSEWIDWNQLGRDVTSLFCNAGTIVFLNGALYSSIPKQSSKRGAEKTPEEGSKRRKEEREVEPEHSASTVPTQEENEFTKSTRTLHKRIKREMAKNSVKEVDMMKMFLDKDSFSKTVENFFAGSFLIANGRLGVNIKDNGCAVLQLTHAADEDEQAPVNQGIYSLNPKQVYELIQDCGLAEDLAPDWAKK
ncbi:hypothetical protein WA171_002021 [Blastocystis sp. BT1]